MIRRKVLSIRDAARPTLHSHAARGNEDKQLHELMFSKMGRDAPPTGLVSWACCLCPI